MKLGDPFIVTGASASGKSTLVRFAHKQGYDILPTHTTRPLRPGEVGGVDMVSLSEEAFTGNFANSMYLEPDLDFAYLRSTGIYYGTPKAWTARLSMGGSCAMPTSLTVARIIQCSTQVAWIHLTCPPEVRAARLEQRGVPPDEIQARMHTGESIHTPESADFIVDTSLLTVDGIFRSIQGRIAA